MPGPRKTSRPFRWSLSPLSPLLLAVALGCAVQPRTSPEGFSSALAASINDAQQLSDAGKLPSLQGFVAEIYLGIQRRVPDLPLPAHAFYRALLENAPLVDSGKMSLQELMTSADLRQLQAQREWQAATDAATSARWAAAFTAMSNSYKPAATVNCTSSRVGTYTYTNCR